MSGSKRPGRGSGEHPIVIAFRAKLDSIEDMAPAVGELAARVERLREKSDRPPVDPRREEDEGATEVPVDVVELKEKKP